MPRGPRVSRRQDSSRDTLRAIAAARGWSVGGAVDYVPLRDDPQYGLTLAAEFDTITPENAMKWGEVHPGPDTWAFEQADEIVAFAARHAMRVRGHTLIWHRQLPPWITDGLTADELRRAVAGHIRHLVMRYRGRVSAWDVVNEAVAESGDGLRDTVFLRTLGPAYIREAFVAAREADPDATLFYNDYGAEGMNAKSDRVYDVVSDLCRRGVPIDGVGLQMHVRANACPPVDEIRANVARLAALGLRVAITEMDVSIRDVRGDSLAAQRDTYRDVLRACLDPCRQVSFWGFTDLYTWLPDDAPLLFDRGIVASSRTLAFVTLCSRVRAGCRDPRPFAVGTQRGRRCRLRWAPTIRSRQSCRKRVVVERRPDVAGYTDGADNEGQEERTSWLRAGSRARWPS